MEGFLSSLTLLRAPLRSLRLHRSELIPLTGGCDHVQSLLCMHALHCLVFDCPPEARATACGVQHCGACASMAGSVLGMLLLHADVDLNRLVAAAEQLQHLENLVLEDLQVGQQPPAMHMNMHDLTCSFACVRLAVGPRQAC